MNNGYVKVKRVDHYDELALPTNARRGSGAETEAEFILLNCQHGHHKVWLTRKDIAYAT